MTQDNGARALSERLCASRAPAVTPTGDMFVDDECRALADAILANGAAFLPDVAELDRLRRIEAAARRLDDAYGPRSVGMIWTVTQEMIDAWRDLQVGLEGSARDGG